MAQFSLQFLGATETVTGSKYLLTARGHRVLVDCGMFQGYKELRLRNWNAPGFDVAALDAVVLTHAHIDHSGYLPVLSRLGYSGPVYCSEATYDLCRIMLPDSGRLQEEEADNANRYGWSKHKPARPLYTEKDALHALELFEPQPFGESFEAAPGIRVEMAHAGHILGSALLRISDGSRSILFSGDVGRPNDLIMRPPVQMDAVDYLVVESTYGDRRHPDTDPGDQLCEVIQRTIRRGGVVVMPSFAVGRAQNLLYSIHKLKAAQRIPSVLPVFLNSPMAINVTKTYQKHHDEHRLNPRECGQMGRAARYINTIHESMALDNLSGPMVIIAGSGMATGGRVVHHLERLAPDSRNSIVLTGYQAGGTRGARLQAGETAVKIRGNLVPVRAEVCTLDNFSAHADYVELIDWLRGFPRQPKHTFITHGEPAAATALQGHIEENLGWTCQIPEFKERVELR